MQLKLYDPDADWLIRLRPVRNFGFAPAIARMRKLLKAVLRCYGWRVVDYQQIQRLEGADTHHEGSGI